MKKHHFTKAGNEEITSQLCSKVNLYTYSFKRNYRGAMKRVFNFEPKNQ